MIACSPTGVYSHREGVAVSPVTEKVRRTGPDLQKTVDLMNYEGFRIAYVTNIWTGKRGFYREHAIDVFGYDVGFEALSKEEVFQQLDAWLDSKPTKPTEVCDDD
jgi:hypothetical protein